MTFRITGLDPQQFRHLRYLPADQLALHGARRVIADSAPGFPDRITLRDATPGESLLLLNYTHQNADNAYRSSHAIFILENAALPFDAVGSVPPALQIRVLSLRAFDAQHEMIDAALTPGAQLVGGIDAMFADPRVWYLHVHYATRGCYAARIDRLAGSTS
jgi:hypothetical protein